MILDRLTFEYRGKILIEKVIITPPYRHTAIFPNEGCFIHIKGSNSRVLAAEGQLEVKNNEGVLFQCGVYFVEWLEKLSNENVEVIAVHLFPGVLKDLYKNEFPKTITNNTKSNGIKKIIPDDTISKFIASLEFYFQNPSLVNDDLLELKIKELILLLVHTKYAESIGELFSQLFSPREASLKKIVTQHLFSNVSVDDLAALSNLSTSSFKREFKRVFQDTPINYINTARIKKAEEWLQLSDLSISEISYDLGFNDPLYFTRLFTKKTGISPSAFRAHHQK